MFIHFVDAKIPYFRHIGLNLSCKSFGFFQGSASHLLFGYIKYVFCNILYLATASLLK